MTFPPLTRHMITEVLASCLTSNLLSGDDDECLWIYCMKKIYQFPLFYDLMKALQDILKLRTENQELEGGGVSVSGGGNISY